MTGNSPRARYANILLLLFALPPQHILTYLLPLMLLLG